MTRHSHKGHAVGTVCPILLNRQSFKRSSVIHFNQKKRSTSDKFLQCHLTFIWIRSISKVTTLVQLDIILQITKQKTQLIWHHFCIICISFPKWYVLKVDFHVLFYFQLNNGFVLGYLAKYFTSDQLLKLAPRLSVATYFFLVSLWIVLLFNDL